MMKFRGWGKHFVWITTALTLASACTSFGPSKVPPARKDYAEAIRVSANNELLTNIVRLRFAATPEMLDLSQVVTQYGLTASGTAGATFLSTGDSSVLGIRAEQQDNPTITYAPVAGEEFAVRMLAPLQLYQVLILSRSGWGLRRLLASVVQRMNGLENLEPSVELIELPRPPTFNAFAEAMSLMSDLEHNHAMEVVLLPKHEHPSSRTSMEHKAGSAPGLKSFRYQMVFHPNVADEKYRESITRLKSLLKLDPERNVFPILMRQQEDDTNGASVVIEARSMLSAMLYFAGGIVLSEPESLHYPNTFTSLAALGEPGKRLYPGNLLEIHASRERPVEPYAAAHMHGMWFWIDRYDASSKATFTLLQYLMRLQQAREYRPDSGLLLTIPTK